MLADTYHDPIRLNKLYWSGLICVAAIFLGYLLVTNSHLLVLAALGTAWLFLLPYHAPLSISLSVATFSSAFILPYFPGRPFMWEFAALLGWTGMLVRVFVRRWAGDSIFSSWPAPSSLSCSCIAGRLKRPWSASFSCNAF